MNRESKQCQNCHQEFWIEPEDFSFYEKIKVPPPTFCPECRAKRRLIQWNEHNLFRKKSFLDGQELFSTYPEDSSIKVYSHDYWWSDKWDPMQYGRDYDFKRPFFEQFRDLFYDVPWSVQSVRNMVNSDYCNQANGFKNCYLCFNGGYGENCMYGVAFRDVKDSLDFHAAISCELIYECYQLGKCFKTFFSKEIHDSNNVWFMNDCTNCSNCFGCINLRHKQYYIFNTQYTKDEYEKKIKEFNLGSYKSLMEIKDRFEDFKIKFPVKYIHSNHSVNCSGDYVYWSKNARYCYEVGVVEDSKFIQNVTAGVKDCYDYSNWGDNVELMYESISCGDKQKNIKFCFDCWPACQNLEYCANCHSSSDLFRCVGLSKKQYCVFNRQYTQSEYESLVSKIKEHMDKMPYTNSKGVIYKYGEFIPSEFSPLAYNETKAQDYHPLDKNSAIKNGYNWKDVNRREFEISISSDDLPDNIKDATDSILKEIISCQKCKRAYRIIGAELELYRRFNLPLPRLCHECRYSERLKSRNPHKLWKRQCQCSGQKSENGIYQNNAKHSHGEKKCPNEFETSYSPDRLEIVYCENCYNSEVA